MKDRYHQERKAVAKLVRQAKRELEPQLQGQNIEPYLVQALVAQNAMRICLETVLRGMLPYDARFLAELGTRLAAYCVTAGPPHQTHLLIDLIQQDLPAMVENKQKTGSVIKADWITEGPDAQT